MVKMRAVISLSLLSIGIIASVFQHTSANIECPFSEQQDIVVVLDSSTSIARPDFSKQLAFVNSIIEKVGIGPEANQVGVISFSDNYRLNFHLNSNRKSGLSEKKQLQSQVSAIRQMGGGTNTHKPLEYAKRSMFTAQRGDRADKRNVCVVITDGQSYDPARTARAAKALADSGVEMFALGVGPGADRKELLAIAGDESRVFQAISYDELNDISDAFAVTVLDACPEVASTTTTPAPIASPEITGMPQEAVEDGTKISLRCSAETTDLGAKLYWIKGGQRVPRTTHSIEGKFVVSYYSFTSRLAENEDDIACVLEHPSVLDDLRDTVKLYVMAVPGPPVITYNPSQEVYHGMMVSLTCASDTKEPARTDVVWIRSSEKIVGERGLSATTVTNTITLPALLSDSAARYECHVIHPNLPEALIDFAYINVLTLPSPPTITAIPEGAVIGGTRVTLTCVSEGKDKDTGVVWYRDGRPVDRTFSVSGEAIVNAMTVTATTTKEYECRVVHPRLEDDMVAYHTLRVYTLPDAPVIKAPSGSRAPDMSITLECTADNADEDTLLLWMRGDTVIDSSYNLEGSLIKNEYKFMSVDDIEGSRCELQHKYLDTPSSVFPQPPVLPGPPEINDGNPIERVPIGTSVLLRCKSSGKEKETAVIWYRSDNAQLLDRSYTVQGEYVVNELTVRAANNPWSYECRVTHPQLAPETLTASTKVPVYVIPGRPEITGIPLTTVTDGSKVTLICRSRGTSEYTRLIWYRDDRPVDTTYSVTGEFIVNEYQFSASVEDSSRLQCRLEFSPTGLQISDFANIKVQVLPGPPEITGNPVKPVSPGSRVSIVCRSKGSSSDTRLIWYRDGRQVDISYTVSGEYVINEYSLTAKSGPTTTLQCRLEFPPTDLERSASVLVSMQGKPGPPKITGVPKEPVSPGTSVTLLCQSAGTSDVTKLLWYHNGIQVDGSYEIKDDHVVNSYVFEASLGETRPVECRLEYQPDNIRQSAYASVPVIGIPGHPEIAGVPTTHISPGSIVRLKCRSLGTSNDTRLVWYRDGTLVDSSYYTSEDYVINEYEFSGTANGRSNLQCRMIFSPTSLQLNANAEIFIQDNRPGKPQISGEPDSAQLTGTVVRLVCRSLGTSLHTSLVWYQNGVQVDDSYSIADGHVQNVFNYTVGEAGNEPELECRLLFPPANLQFSVSIVILVQEIPGDPEITNVPDQPQPAGTTVKVVCRSKGTAEPTRLVWFKDGDPVDTSFAVSGGYIVNEYEFVVPPQGLSKLECRMEFPPTNLWRFKIAIVHTQKVEKPTIVQHPPSVEQGADVVLTCSVRHHGDSNIRLEWYQNGLPVDGSYETEGDYVVNRFDTTAWASDNSFECRLNSEGRLVNVPLILDIYFLPPSIISKPHGTANPGERVNLTCAWVYTTVSKSASLRWVDSFTKVVVPSANTVDGDVLTAEATVIADPSSFNIYDCEVVGETGMDNETLIDRVKVPVEDPEPLIDCSTGGAEIDVVIIIDSSTSLTRNDFQKQVDFVSRFSGAFDIGRDNVQVGLISFSSDTSVHFYMNDHNNKADLLDAISKVKQVGGGTNTHLPIKRAREELFTRRYGDRPDVKNLCIVVTDGRSYNPALTAVQAQLARDAGIEMYAIGIGRGVDVKELVSISGSEGRVYYAENYNSLEAIENKFVEDTKVSVGPCPVATTTPRPIPNEVAEWGQWSGCSTTCGAGSRTRYRTCRPGNDGQRCPAITEETTCIEKICDPKPGDCITLSHEADIAFLLDTSSSVYQPDFEKMKMFLADFIDLFNISDTRQRIASLTFSDDVRVNFQLGDYNTNEGVKNAFMKIKMHLGGTRTDDAIRFARQEVFSEFNGARRNSAKLAFIITDGRSYNPVYTSLEAEMARKSGIIIYSIGIGPEIDQNELETIAGEVSQVFHVDSYDDINQLKKKIGLELSRCYNPLAAVNGGFGAWGEYSGCSVTCGTGSRTRTRQCDSPAPRNGGKPCDGPASRTKRCKKPSCHGIHPTPSGWTDWEYSSSCSVTCGEGTQEVSRVCQYEEGCSLGQVERKVIKCQLARCTPVDNEETCGGVDGINVMFASQGINSNGPNSYFAVDLIANATALLSVDGNRVRTSLTLSDCSCGKNTGYELTHYRNYEEIYNHLHDLDLGDTASLLRKVRSENNIVPSMSRSKALSDDRKHVLVYVFDANDVITQEAVSEAKKLKLAGVTIHAVVLDRNVNLQRIGQIVSQPSNAHLQFVDANNGSGDDYVQELYVRLCKRNS